MKKAMGTPEATVASLETRLTEKKEELLRVRQSLLEQSQGVANQLFLIEQLENPGAIMDPTTGKAVPADELPDDDTMAPNDTADGHI